MGETTKERGQEAAAGKAPKRRPFSRGNMKKDDPSPRELLASSCPTCGAAPGEKCQLTSGQPRTEPHRDRRLLAKD